MTRRLCRTALLRLIVALTIGTIAGASTAFAQASAPVPANNATGVPPSTSLSWTADPKGNRYDVDLGTVNPPPQIAKNLNAVRYQPAPLAPSTTYFWRLISKGPMGYSATGPVWKFTTAAAPPPPPSVPSNPAPSSGAVGVSISTTLSWAASTNATSYTVRFGTTNPPPTVSSSQAGTTYQPATALAYATTYYWSVTANGAGGTTAGPIWSFVTQPAPPPSTTLDRLRVMTWNIQSGKDANGAAAVDAQVALMADSGAHVIALQEVTITPDYGDLTVLYRQKLQALTGVPWYQVWAPAPRPAGSGAEGNLILSRLPIQSSQTTQFDTVPSDPTWLDVKRSVAEVTVVVNDIQVKVFGTHLAVDATQRQSQLDLVQSWAGAFPAPRLLGGDFNMVPGDSVYTDMAGTYNDTWQLLVNANDIGYTKDVRQVSLQPGRIDYWWQEKTDTHARASEIWVVKTARSDHHAVVADVDVK
jgi:endonuclease/exonuclease/phosphatase family metal-dependent hydrolase